MALAQTFTLTDSTHTNLEGEGAFYNLTASSWKLLQIRLKKNKPYQHFPFRAVPADAQSKVKENEPYHLPARPAPRRER